MPRIYLISRADETINLSDYLAELLRTRYGTQNVLRGSVARSGAEYAATVERDLRRSDVALVVVGPHWLTNPGADGQPWLSQPDDPMRIALATALRLEMLIAPVLSDGAKMPLESDLPPDLRRFPQIQGFPVRPAPDFQDDMNRLYQQINTKLTWRPASGALMAVAVVSTLAWVLAQLLVNVGRVAAAVPAPTVNELVVLTFVLGAITLLVATAVAVIIAIQRRRRRWLWLLLGIPTLILLTAHMSVSGLTGLLILGLLAALIVFALVGPRRETAFA